MTSATCISRGLRSTDKFGRGRGGTGQKKGKYMESEMVMGRERNEGISRSQDRPGDGMAGGHGKVR